MEFQLWTKVDEEAPAVKPLRLVTEDNELGVKALKTRQRDGKYTAENVLDAHLTINADEGRTIVWALEAYRDKMLDDIKRTLTNRDHRVNYNEDLAHLALMLQRVTQLLFTMQEDHNNTLKDVVDCWFNV